MLNIRKSEMVWIVIAAVYALVLGTIPHALAVLVPQEPEVVVVTVDPLDKYKGVKELSDTELVDMLSVIGFEGKALKVAYAVAKKESNGRPLAHNGDSSTGDNSYG